MTDAQRLLDALRDGPSEAARAAANALLEAETSSAERTHALRAFAEALPDGDADGVAAWLAVFSQAPNDAAACAAVVAHGREDQADDAARVLLALDDASEEEYALALSWLAERQRDPARAAALRDWAEQQGVTPLLRAFDVGPDVGEDASASDVRAPSEPERPVGEAADAANVGDPTADEDTAETDEPQSAEAETDEDTAETDEDTAETDEDTAETDEPQSAEAETHEPANAEAEAHKLASAEAETHEPANAEAEAHKLASAEAETSDTDTPVPESTDADAIEPESTDADTPVPERIDADAIEPESKTPPEDGTPTAPESPEDVLELAGFSAAPPPSASMDGRVTYRAPDEAGTPPDEADAEQRTHSGDAIPSERDAGADERAPGAEAQDASSLSPAEARPDDAPEAVEDAATDDPSEAVEDAATDHASDAVEDAETDDPSDAVEDAATDDAPEAVEDAETDDPSDAVEDAETDDPSDAVEAAETDTPSDAVDQTVPVPGFGDNMTTKPLVDGPVLAEVLRLERVLDSDPTQLESFQQLTGLLAEEEVWTELAAAYSRMIARTEALEPRNVRLEGVLWRKLAELLIEKLGDRTRGVEAAERALGAHPTVDAARTASIIAAHVTPPARALAYAAQRAAPYASPVLDALGRTLQRDGRETEASIALQCAALTSKGDASIDVRASSVRPRDWARGLTPVDVDTALRPAHRDAGLDRFFAALHPLIAPLYAQSEQTFELSERNKLAPEDPLEVSRIARSLWSLYGYSGAPDLYVYRSVTGFSFAFFGTPAFLVGRDLVQGITSGRMRYRIGCTLAWAQPRAFLAGLLSETHLLRVVEMVFDLIRPGGSVTVTKEFQRMKRRLSEAPDLGVTALRSAVESMRRPSEAEIRSWRVQVAVESMRTGALFCGLPALVLDELVSHPPLDTPLSSEEWQREAIAFLASGAHLELRGALMGERRSAIETQEL